MILENEYDVNKPRKGKSADKERIGSWSATFTNIKFYPLDPRPEEICLEDIAQGLSMSCRYSGQVKKFYSVAQHSVLICDACQDIEDKRYALMHDASEAYISDIPRPLKWHLPEYIAVEKKLQEVIKKKYNLQEPSWIVDFLDYNIVADEAIVLFKVVPEWAYEFELTGIKIEPWTPAKAKREFLERAKVLL